MAAAAASSGPSSARPATAIPFSTQYQIAPWAQLSRSDSDPRGLKVAALMQRVSLEDYLGAPPALDQANELGKGKEGIVYSLKSPNFPVKEVAFKHLDPSQSRPQTPAREVPVYVKNMNQVPPDIGIVQTFAIVVRNGADLDSDHVIAREEDLITEIEALEPQIQAAEDDPLYKRDLLALEGELDDLKYERDIHKAKGYSQLHLNQFESRIAIKQNELEELKIRFRLKIVGIIMQKLRGDELFQFLIANGALTPRRAVSYSLQMLKALKFLHDRNQMHRDLKPENMFLDINDITLGRLGTLRIADFGMAKFLGLSRDPRMQTSCGSPHYAAPEVWKGMPYNHDADVYSAGMIMYAMISNQLPFDDDNLRTLGDMIASYYDGINSSFEFYMGDIDKQKRPVVNRHTKDAIHRTMSFLSQLRGTRDPCALALADVIVGLTRAKRSHRMKLDTAINILEKADRAQIARETQQP